jgi:hypothetical protein
VDDTPYYPEMLEELKSRDWKTTTEEHRLRIFIERVRFNLKKDGCLSPRQQKAVALVWNTWQSMKNHPEIGSIPYETFRISAERRRKKKPL